MSKYQRVLLFALAAAMVVSCIKPLYPQEMYLQHSPTVILIVGLLLTARKFPLSNAAFTCIVLFAFFHVLGARYIYSYVPYDSWSEKLFGVHLTAAFGFQRNHYDRLVHFLFGALWIRPVYEVCTRNFGVPPRFAYYTAFEFVLAFSMLYELFEWGLAVALSPADAAAYNGQQGDMWDAQKDMSCAVVGALAGVLIVALVGRRLCDNDVAQQ